MSHKCGEVKLGRRFSSVLRRVVYQRVRDELYKNGIALAHRRVQIELPGPAENTGDDVKRRAAAEAVLEGEAQISKPVPNEP